MTNPQRDSSLATLPLIISGGVLVIGCVLLGLAAFFVFRPTQTADLPALEAATTQPATRSVTFPTATSRPTDAPTPTPTDEPPTATPESTTEATGEPTSAPTTAPAQAATSAPRPTNPPPPTNTPVPPTAPPASSRILNPAFSLEAQAVPVNQAVWFNFSVTNASTTKELFYGALGAAILKDGVPVHFQGSYTNASLQPGQQLNWRDHTAIGTPGVYQLQLAICYTSPLEACSTAGADWEMLSPPITVTIQ
jgi:hypothetical protein